jgi:hypothetical protein
MPDTSGNLVFYMMKVKKVHFELIFKSKNTTVKFI